MAQPVEALISTLVTHRKKAAGDFLKLADALLSAAAKDHANASDSGDAGEIRRTENNLRHAATLYAQAVKAAL